jgi:hypothetical protein
MNVRRLDRRLSQLQATCREEGKREREKPEFKDIDFELTCDPIELASLKEDSVGVQGEIVTARRQLTSWEDRREWLGPVALAMMLIGALPMAWYFLLRRIRELSDAITGKQIGPKSD